MQLELANEIFAGGPGSGCTGPNCGRPPGKILLHGTDLQAAKQILRQGLVPGHKGIWGRIGIPYGHLMGRVFLTSSLKSAKFYAQGAGLLQDVPGGDVKRPEEYAVVKLQLPKEIWSKMETDDMDAQAKMYRGHIPAEYIKEVQVYDGNTNKLKGKLTRRDVLQPLAAEAVELVTAYVPFLKG